MSEVKRFVVDMQGRGEECVLATDYAALEAECERLRQQPARDSAELRRLCAERDALRQQLAERDATIERLEAGIPRLQEQAYQARTQRDKLAGLLREVSNSESRGLDWAKQINAALAEIKP